MPKFSELIQKIKIQNPALSIKKLDHKIALIRGKKEAEEINQIQKAIDITQVGFVKVFQKIKAKKLL